MARLPGPLFLARQSYRRRRLGDAAKLLPVFGWVLIMLPILWAGVATTAGGFIYLFVVWALLIAFIGVVSHFLSKSENVPSETSFVDPEEH